ncbi:MAG: MetQ/NlpA family ABC transporter substrate-binding protein [Angelakisella sp.]
MKFSTKRIISLTLALTLSLAAAGCGSTPASSGSAPASTPAPASEAATSAAPAPSTEAPLKLVVGASPAPHAEILESVKEQLLKEGIALEIQEFTDYVLPNNALSDKLLDANYFQHQPYLTDFNAKNKTDLVSAAAIHFEPLGIYPGKTATLAEIKDGATIAVPNDTTNEARALNLLAAQGWFTLKAGAGLAATPKDIEQNPKKLKFVELAAEQIPNAIGEVDFAVINGNYALPAGLIDKVLVVEDPKSAAAQEFANILAIRPDSKDDPRIAALVKALTSEETRKFIDGKYGVTVVPVF